MGEIAVKTACLRMICLRDVNGFSESSLIAASRGVCGTYDLPEADLLP